MVFLDQLMCQWYGLSRGDSDRIAPLLALCITPSPDMTG